MFRSGQLGLSSLILCCVGLQSAIAGTSPDVQAQIGAGAEAREHGEVELSIELLQSAVGEARSLPLKVQALTQLGVSLTAADRLPDAQRALELARASSTDADRAPVELALGNVFLRRHDPQGAAAMYRAVVTDAGARAESQGTALAAKLNLARIEPERSRLAALADLFPQIQEMLTPLERGVASLNLANQSSAIFATEVQIEKAAAPAPDTSSNRRSRGARAAQALSLSYRGFSEAAAIGRSSNDVRLQLEAEDGLAQLYESDGRLQEALTLCRKAVTTAASAPVSQVQDLLMRFEWRTGRLQRALGNRSEAVASYLRTADLLVAIREDLPLEDGNGRSNFRAVFRPVYNDLTDLLLTDVDKVSTNERAQRLTAVTQVIEVTRQAELQDFLGDRCSVESSRKDRASGLDGAVAVLYTAVLKNRLELVLQTASDLEHSSAAIAEPDLNKLVLAFRRGLLNSGSTAFRADAQRLYQMLVEPFVATLARSGIHYLVIVPDGPLRLVPFAALHDSQRFLGERYAVSLVVGLTLTNNDAVTRPASSISLLLGLSKPGPVVGKLVSLGLAPQTRGAILASRGGDVSEPRNDVGDAQAARPSTDRSLTERSLQRDLALPGVQDEIRGLSSLARNTALVDESFTLSGLRSALLTGKYDRLHLASHAFFGNSARDSFLLAYDDVIRIDDLQGLISSNLAGGATLDLLTLSACDTAEGDDRAPLGFAGAAIKARARSVVGSLWAVNDAATQRFMRVFYGSLANKTKADALADAQRSLIASTEYSHPYYWAAFSLIGEWR